MPCNGQITLIGDEAVMVPTVGVGAASRLIPSGLAPTLVVGAPEGD